MTVSSTTARVSYSGNGTTTVFPVPFYFLASSDLLVVLRSSAGIETQQVLNTNYTVTGAGVLSGGSVTMTVAPPSGTSLIILRNVALTQATDFLPNDRLPAESLEQTVDKLTMIAQQLDGVNDRSLRFPVSDSSSLTSELPSSSARAGKFLGFDSSGNAYIAAGPATPYNSEDVAFVQAGSGAIVRNVRDKLREPYVSVKDFGAVGDGVTNDRAAIQAAFDTGVKNVYFPSGTYFVGSTATAGFRFIQLLGLGDGISILTGKSVTIKCQVTADVVPIIFHLYNNSNFYCGPIKLECVGYNPNVDFRGPHGFYLDNNPSAGVSTDWGDVTIDSIYGKNLVSVVAVAGNPALSGRIRGIHIKQIYSDDCYYGINFQNQGDAVVIDNIIASQNRRPYFAYGVSGHRVKVFERANRGSTGPINISRSPGGLNTKDIEVFYTAREEVAGGTTYVLINHIDLLGGEISNIRVNLDIESSASYYPVQFVNYTGAGGSATSAPSLNRVYDITISGSCNANALACTAQNATYTDKGNIYFIEGKNLTYDSTLKEKFIIGAARFVTQAMGAVNVRSYGAVGNGTADDTSAIQSALNTGLSVMFPEGEYLCANLSVTNPRQRLYAVGDVVLLKNANGPILTASGNDFEADGIRFNGTALGAYTGDGLVITGVRGRVINCSATAAGRAVKITGSNSEIIGTHGAFTTSDSSASGYDIEVGISGSLTEYVRVSSVITTQSTGGILMTDVGSCVIDNSVFGKLTIQSGTSPSGVGGNIVDGNTILGAASVGLSDTVLTGNKFSSTVTFTAGVGGCSLDASNLGITSVTNSGNANNLIVRQTAASGNIDLTYGGSTWTNVVRYYSSGNIGISGALLPGGTTSLWTSGAGTPEGAVTAPVGSLYTRTDGGANTTLYVKESGAGNTGWVAK